MEIHYEEWKRKNFNDTDKYYTHKLKYIVENMTDRIISFFEIQMDQPI